MNIYNSIYRRLFKFVLSNGLKNSDILAEPTRSCASGHPPNLVSNI
jgi:hypothetical protein